MSSVLHMKSWVLMQICNAGLKLMLKDCTIREIEEYKDKVSELGAGFSEKNDLQGATFAYVLYSMAEHVQVKAVDNLQVSLFDTAWAQQFVLEVHAMYIHVLIS